MKTTSLLRLLLISLALIVLALSGAGAPVAQAATTITVNTTADELNNDGDCSLREAIQAANTDTVVDACPAGSGSDTIVLPAGTYTLSLDGTDEDANQTGDLDITGNLTLIGAGASRTIIQSNYVGLRDRAFDIQSTATVSLSNLAIRNFGETLVDGGGIRNQGKLTVSDSELSGNSAVFGGGIENLGTLTVSRSTLMGNYVDCPCGSAIFGFGGAISNSGTLTLVNSTLSSNRAGDQGGGLYHSSGQAVITNSTISDNGAHLGGGIWSNALLTISNSTITDNSAFTACDYADCYPGTGGGIDGASTVRNTIIAENTDTSGEAPDCSGTLNSQGYNLIQNTRGCTITGNTTGNKYGVDPLLGPLTNNGGPTQTHALLSGSPALDAGNPAPPGSGGNACEPKDQRGVARPQDGNGDGTARCDMGAFERAAPFLTVRVDIKPGDSTNTINLKSQGVIPVAILSTSTFDARSVDVRSVCFGDAEAPAQRDCTEAHGKGHLQDVNGDGRVDLLLHYETQQTGIDPGDKQACLTGKTTSGSAIQGCDAIRTVP